MHRCPYYYVLEDVMRDRASSMPLSTMSSIGNLKILDDDGRAGELDENKPIEVDTTTFKHVVGDLPTLKKKPRTSPSSLSSDLTELSQLKREQMIENRQYKKMQFGLEERTLELLEQESTIRLEKLKAEAARECLQLKVDILRQRVQLLKEGVPQDKINSALPVPEHSDYS